ncbi:hypothetical protein THRCLA_07944 [Thraustotheca clavata]|uniref:EGF-like domain-containing protein n=1 Tax=Thraustotheca clavata TaxID=74557 RepID=A0A1V9ZBH6_9STRA|nr:hypothetical protein THRCLA_07944 [Thraustotheca clavata]
MWMESNRMLWLLVCFVAVVQAQLALRQNKVVYFPDSERYQVNALLRALSLHGMSELKLDSPTWSVAGNTNVFDLLWAQEDVRWDSMGKLEPRHKVNQISGLDALLATLSSTHAQLQKQHGKFDFNFVQSAFYLPRDKAALEHAILNVLNSPIYNDKVKRDSGYRRRWLVTSPESTRLLKGLPEVQNNQLPANAVVTKYIEPFLISNHKFEFSLYVLVASLDPLRVYIYDNAQVRFCLKPYPKALDATADIDSYFVGDNYLPPWEIPDLKDYYTEFPSSTSEGTNHFRVLKQYLSDHNIDVDRFQRDTFAMITKLVTAKRKDALGSIPQHVNTNNLFEFLRFDFHIQDDGLSFLKSIVRSPILQSTAEFSTGSEAAMFNSLASDLIQLIGVTSPNDKDMESTIQSNPTYCKEKCKDQQRVWDMTCWRCAGWFPPQVAESLRDSAMEYARRGRFQLVYPSVENKQTKFIQGLTANDEAFHAYLVSFAQAAAAVSTSLLDPAVLCVNRDHCNNHGDCVNGRCQCDDDYEGFTCYIPHDSSEPKWTDVPTPRVQANLRFQGTVKSSSPSFLLVAIGLGVVCFGLYKIALKYVVVAQAEKDN